jgi:polysaccharide biosynthesis PFTS motif protein
MKFIRRLLIKDLFSRLEDYSFCLKAEQRPEFFKKLRPHLIDITNEFVRINALAESSFVKDMNGKFKTNLFGLLLKRWALDYFFRLFDILDNCAVLNKKIILEDIPLNRFAVKEYSKRFNILGPIEWENGSTFFQRLFSIFVRCNLIVYLSLNKGIRISKHRKKYKVMREALWGLYGAGGYYFHDDFLVDGNNIKKEDLLLFSRGVPKEIGRLKGYKDAKKSCYAHFDLHSLSINLGTLFMRIVPKYIFSTVKTFLKEIESDNFTIYWSVYAFFIYNALPYERVFSHFEVRSELGHNYFSAGHIAEAIVCQNYGTKYYLMHWSDNTLPIIRYSIAFLGCNKFLTWGRAHMRGVECNPNTLIRTGFVFKRFIKDVSNNRNKVLSDMRIAPRGKIVTFFDESFGFGSEMTEEHFVIFWKAILKLAELEKDNTIVVKPKYFENYKALSQKFKKEYTVILERIKKLRNAYIINERKWSFIEAIGISDIVITQGMTSSATIAIICGIEGLYLDQFGYEHQFSKLFKDRIVFDDVDKLIDMVHKIIIGEESPQRDISEDLLRDFDEYPDERGIDLFRDIFSGQSNIG